MKESIIDVLMNLFKDSLVVEECAEKVELDIVGRLQGQGYTVGEIQKALSWLECFSDVEQISSRLSNYTSLRIFSFEERQKIEDDSRNYLIHLGNLGLLTNGLRERIIDRIMALDEEVVSFKQVQWIACMVFINQDHDVPPETMQALMRKILSPTGHIH